jgi:hypothetical protein
MFLSDDDHNSNKTEFVWLLIAEYRCMQIQGRVKGFPNPVLEMQKVV